MDQLIEGLQITQWNQMNASFKMAVGKKKLQCVGHGVYHNCADVPFSSERKKMSRGYGAKVGNNNIRTGFKTEFLNTRPP